MADTTFDPDAASAAFDKAHYDFQAIPLHPEIVLWIEAAANGIERLVAAGILSPLGRKVEDGAEALAVGAAGALAGGAVASTGAAPLSPLAAGAASTGAKLAIDYLRAELDARAQAKLGGTS